MSVRKLSPWQRMQIMARTERQVRWLQRKYKLTHWDIDIRWDAGPDDEGRTSVEPDYQRATLHFNVHEVKAQVVAHEWGHVLVSRLASVAMRYAKAAEGTRSVNKKAINFAEDEVCTAMECGIMYMLRGV